MAQTRSDLGIGRTRGDTQNRRYASAPNNVSSNFSVEEDRLTTIVESGIDSKKRKAPTLTPDNADSVLSACFDLKTFIKRLSDDVDLVEDEEALFRLLKGCVVDKEIVAFTSVAERHLTLLGLDFSYDLQIDNELAKAANDPNSFPNSNLNNETLKAVQKHFNVSKESGCRCVIDQYLLAAVVYAQTLIDSDKTLRNELFNTYMITDPHVAVFTELQVPHTRVSYNGTSYVFHGFLDYGVGFIKARDLASLTRGSLKLSVSNTLSGVLEAKSLSEMQNAVPQITVQVLTILALTGRKSFTGALTNGALWRFFTAYDGEEQIRIYTSQEFATDSDTGLIIELLKDMILYTASPMITTDFNKVIRPPTGKRRRTE